MADILPIRVHDYTFRARLSVTFNYSISMYYCVYGCDVPRAGCNDTCSKWLTFAATYMNNNYYNYSYRHFRRVSSNDFWPLNIHES